MSDWVNFRNIENLVKERNNFKPSDFIRIYRMIWTIQSSTLSRLLRITTNDLRFWLTDKSYSKAALEWAREKDIPELKTFFIKGFNQNDIFFPSLETKNGIDEFWKKVDHEA